MDNTIWKYRIDHSEQRLMLPKDSYVLSAHEQDGKVQLWAIVDTDKDADSAVDVRVFITGSNLPRDIRNGKWRFIDTIHIRSLVYHVFVKGA